MIIQRQDGSVWSVGAPTKTSDGFLLASGFMIDPETKEEIKDDEGFPIIHSFFLGRSEDVGN